MPQRCATNWKSAEEQLAGLKRRSGAVAKEREEIRGRVEKDAGQIESDRGRSGRARLRASAFGPSASGFVSSGFAHGAGVLERVADGRGKQIPRFARNDNRTFDKGY